MLVWLAGAVREPFAPGFSNAQKKRVLLGCPARLTGMLPAKLRGREPVMFGSLLVTSKSGRKARKLSASMENCCDAGEV